MASSLGFSFPSGRSRCLSACLIVGALTVSVHGQEVFLDKTVDAELDSYVTGTGDGHGPGATFADLDNDGYPELVVAGGPGGSTFVYRNEPKPSQPGARRFVPAALGGANTYGSTGAVAGDYDNDGDLDLFVIFHPRNSLPTVPADGDFRAPNKLFRNELIPSGALTFTDVTSATDPTPGVNDDQYGLQYAKWDSIYLDNSLTAAWADIDRDGDLDLYVGNHNGFGASQEERPADTNHPSYTRPGQRDILYRNNGDGTFTDITMTTGGAPGYEDSLGAHVTSDHWFASTNAVIFGDFDEDGWPDLFVTNKTNGDEDMLYINQGISRGAWQGYATRTYAIQDSDFPSKIAAPMGIDAADYDNDGDLDVYITNISQNDLFVNRVKEDGTLSLDWLATGEVDADWSWGTQFLDVDNDGWLDIHVATQSGRNDYLYLQNPVTHSYSDQAAVWGVAQQQNTRGNPAADYERDGDIDLFVVNFAGSVLYENQIPASTGSYHFLTLKLIGDPSLPPAPFLSSRDAIGARVQVSANTGAGTITQMREVTSGHGNAASTSSLELELGLGSAASADVTVDWPSGRTLQLTNVAVDRFLTIPEAAILADSFNTDTVDRQAGDALIGDTIELSTLGARTWQGANSPVLSDKGFVTNVAGTNPRAAVPFDPGAFPDQRITLEADLNTTENNPWVSLGFMSGTGSVWSSGEVWMLVRRNGRYTVYARATSHNLAQGTVAVPAAAPKHAKVEYDTVNNSVSAWIDGVAVLVDHDLAGEYDPGVDPAMSHVGFTSYYGATGFPQADMVTFDNFKVTLASASCQAPVITQQPVSQIVNQGETATFNVMATGLGLSYQWRKNSSNLAGATGPSLAILNAQPSDAGGYDVVVSNACGSLTSRSATLTVNPTTPPTGGEADFDGDGFADLAIGIPGETIGTLASAGSVQVVYGAASGLAATGNQTWDQNTPGIGGLAEATDEFGGAVTVGDFDGDGFTDLAIGAPGEAIGALQDGGAIHTIYGASGGLVSTGSQIVYQSLPTFAGTSGASDRFGEAITAGDFDGDGFVDLAVGVPGDTVGSVVGAGSIHLLYGSASGLDSSRDVILSQDTVGVPGGSETGDRFGGAVAAGDFDADGFDDLAVGAPGEALGSTQSAGAVNVLFGSAAGLIGTGSQLLHQDSTGVSDTGAVADEFGAALTVGDFDDDGFADLAVGVPGETVSGGSSAGAFHVLHGSANGLSTAGEQFWHQNSAGIAGGAESGDRVGSSLAVGDFDGDGFDDLAVGAHGEALGSVSQAGLAHVLYGSSNSLSSTGSQQWHQDTSGVEDVAETADQFATSLSAADFDGDGRDDLAVGVPGESVGSVANAGAVNVLYGSISGITTTGNQLWHQDSAGILDTAESGDRLGHSVH